MGAAMPRPSAGRSRSGKRFYTPQAEMNVTPMVDVMLVLLIIFMVSAPLLTVGVNVTLPDAQAQPLETSNDPVIVTVPLETDGTVFINELEVPVAALTERLRALTGENSDIVIRVRADQEVRYQRFMEVVATIYRAGFQRIAMETNPGGG